MTDADLRPLKPLEIALLRAVHELGDEASGIKVRRHMEAAQGGKMVSIGWLYMAADRLEEEGFIRSFDVTTDRVRRHWRAVFDLTEVLKG